MKKLNYFEQKEKEMLDEKRKRGRMTNQTQIRQQYRHKLMDDEIAAKYNVSKATIHGYAIEDLYKKVM